MLLLLRMLVLVCQHWVLLWMLLHLNLASWWRRRYLAWWRWQSAPRAALKRRRIHLRRRSGGIDW
jgi:hypothetical protein